MFIRMMVKANTKRMLRIFFLVLVEVLLFNIFPFRCFASDILYDTFKYMEQNTNNGRGFSDSNNGSSLAWGEAYILEGFLGNYEAYKDLYWMDKFVDHFDRMKANAYDHDGNGKVGWGTYNSDFYFANNFNFELDGADDYTVNLINNGGFETANQADSTLPEGWTRYNANSSLICRSGTVGDRNSGSYGLVLKSDGTSNAYIETPVIGHKASNAYSVEFYTKVNNKLVVPVVELWDYTTGAKIASDYFYYMPVFTNTQFRKTNLTWICNVDDSHDIRLRIKFNVSDRSSWEARIDDVSLKLVSYIDSDIANGGMEYGAQNDSTLPEYWNRYGSTSSTYAYRFTTDKYSGNYGLVIKSDGLEYKVLEQSFTFYPNQRYRVGFWGRTNNTSAYGLAKAVWYPNGGNASVVGYVTFNSTNWTQYSFDFTAPSSTNGTLKIFLQQNDYANGSYIAYYDDVNVKPVESVKDSFANKFEFNNITNGEFYDGTFDSWIRQGDPGNYIYLTNTAREYYDRGYGAMITSDGSTNMYLKQTLVYVPQTKHLVTFYAKTNKADAIGLVEIYDETTSSVIASSQFGGSNGDDWMLYSLQFDAPSAGGHTVVLRFSQYVKNAGYKLYVDAVTMNPIVKTAAAGWERTGADRTTAYRTNDPNIAYSTGGYAMAVSSKAGGMSQHVEQEIRGYDSGVKMGVNYLGKVNKSTAQGKISVIDVNAGTTLAYGTFNNTVWSDAVQLSFNAPTDTSHILKIRLEQTTTADDSSIAYFANIKATAFYESQVQEAQILINALRFVKMVYSNSQLSSYTTKANEYLTFYENNFKDKYDAYWEDIDATRSIYKFPLEDTGSFVGRSSQYNKSGLWEILEIYYGDIKGGSVKTTYYNRATKILNQFKANMTVSNNTNWLYNSQSYNWRYWDNTNLEADHGFWYVPAIAEDTSHAENNVLAILESYKRGLVFNSSDMKKVISANIDVMWNRSLTNSMMGGHILASGSDYLTDYSWFSKWSPRWVGLSPYYSSVWDVWKGALNPIDCMSLMAGNLAVNNPETTMNSSFEIVDLDDSTMPAQWTRWQGDSSHIYRDTANRYYGDAGLTIKTNGTLWILAERQMKYYIPNSTYTVNYQAKTDGSGIKARAEIYNATTDTVLGFQEISSTSWSAGSITFKTPSNGTDVLKIRLYEDSYTTANRYVYFDDVRIMASLWKSVVVNGSFEYANSFFTSLPLFWNYGANTLASNAGIEAGTYYEGQKSVMVKMDTSTGTQELIQAWKGYSTSADYILTFYGKVDASGGIGKIYIKDNTTNTVLASQSFSNTDWQQYNISFTTPGTNTDDIKVYITHDMTSANGRKAYVDELAVLKN